MGRLDGLDMLLTAALLAIGNRVLSLLLLLLVIVLVTLVGACRNPESALVGAPQRCILAGEVDRLTLVTVVAALRESAGADRELGGDGSILLDPVGKGILAVLDDTTSRVSI